MVGSGVLREALADSSVTSVLSISRKPSGVSHPKLNECLISNLFDPSPIENRLAGWDGCVWALGISSIGLDEAAYAKVTEDLTLLWAHLLLSKNPNFSFAYCSAQGADTKAMWGRVRRRVETALKEMSFRHAGCVRPGMIRPGPGIKSKVWIYQTAITLFKPLFPLLLTLAPQYVTTSERLGRAMLRIVQGRADRYILESIDINRIGG